MLKYPSPIEKELDKVRDKMWREAGRNPDQWFAIIRERNRELDRELKKTKRQTNLCERG